MSREVASAWALARASGGRWQRLPLLISPPSSPQLLAQLLGSIERRGLDEKTRTKLVRLASA